MNTNLIRTVILGILFLGEIVHANPTGVCKVGIITADIVEEKTRIPSRIQVEQLSDFLRKNLVDSKDILGIKQVRGNIYILAKNISTITNDNACDKILKALPNYTEKKIVICNEKFVSMEIPIESLDRCFVPAPK